MYESSCRPLQVYLLICGYKWDCIFLNLTVCIFLCEAWTRGHTISACSHPSLSHSVKHNTERWLELLCPCFIDLQLFLYLPSLCLATGCVRHSIPNTRLCCSLAKGRTHVYQTTHKTSNILLNSNVSLWIPGPCAGHRIIIWFLIETDLILWQSGPLMLNEWSRMWAAREMSIHLSARTLSSFLSSRYYF